jgi:hypothetical protein
LLFLNPSLGASVMDVYRLARLYDVIELRTALIMLAAWRGSALAVTRAKYRPALYDDERQRAVQHQRRRVLPPKRGTTPGARPVAWLGFRKVEEMPPCPVLDLDNPDIRIEIDFLGEPRLDRRFVHRLRRRLDEDTFHGPAVIVSRLRRGNEQQRRSIHQGDLHKYRTGLLRAPSPDAPNMPSPWHRRR